MNYTKKEKGLAHLVEGVDLLLAHLNGRVEGTQAADFSLKEIYKQIGEGHLSL